MKKLFLFLIVVLSPVCMFSQSEWRDLVVTENSEVYIDSLTIREVNGSIYATTKTIYTTQEARDAYVNNIKRVFPAKSADKKIAKWNGFGYSITQGIYDCSNKRFKILQVEDYTQDGKRIVRTKTKENKAKWLNVDIDTVGDYVLFYICDYENR